MIIDFMPFGFNLFAHLGPINNKSLIVNMQTGPTLRPNVDHYKFSENIWKFFLSQYGGGPEVMVTNEGGVRVSSPAPPAAADNVREAPAAADNSVREDLHLED